MTQTATPTLSGFYGEAPVGLGPLDLSKQWTEFMHYLYLPVRIPASDPGLRATPSTFDDGITVPKALEFLRPAVRTAMADARATTDHLDDPYVYVTARRGFATPGNPLNRPGLHTDDFGGTDLNYIWTDRFPTRFLLDKIGLDVSCDDATSMREFEAFAFNARINSMTWNDSAPVPGVAPTYGEGPQPGLRIVDGSVNMLLRLSPYVIHSTPKIPAPGGMRSFFKISVSTHRYDLLGNSHNYDLDYQWEMFDRAAVRNQPQAEKNKGALA